MRFDVCLRGVIYLDSSILQWLIRIGDIFKRNAIELAFVDVGDAVILPSLTGRDGRFEKVFEANIGEAKKVVD